MSNQYNFSPSLINDFISYVNEEGFERDGEFIPFIDQNTLIRRINKYPSAMNDGAKKGIDFENVLLGGSARFGYDFDEDLLNTVRSYLPKYYSKQLWVEAELKDLKTKIGGYCDIVGGGEIIDIKTTSTYTFPKFLQSAQLLYMLALRECGVDKMSFLITNFNDVFKEDYTVNNVNFSSIYEYIERLQVFINSNLNKITNLKVIGRENEMQWLDESKYKGLLAIAYGSEADKEFVKQEMTKYKMKTIYRDGLLNILFNN